MSELRQHGMRSIFEQASVRQRPGRARQPRAETAAACSRCGDRGWLIKPDGGAGTARPCVCCDPAKNEAALVRSLRAAGLRTDEVRSALRRWNGSHQREPTWALQWIASWFDRPKVGEKPPAPTVTLYGHPGRGKTKLAAILSAEWLRRGGRGLRWLTVPLALSRILEERREGPSAGERQALEARFLILDDFGGHREDGGNRALSLANWVDHRRAQGLPTVITLNVPTRGPTDDPLSVLADPTLESRLYSGRVVEMVADVDFRALPAEHKS